jgi:hypothetical protein
MWLAVFGTKAIGHVNGGLRVEIDEREYKAKYFCVGNFYVGLIATVAMATTSTTTMCLGRYVMLLLLLRLHMMLRMLM